MYLISINNTLSINMNNRLMILGTNEYQNPVIVRAKELGYETHVFGLQRERSVRLQPIFSSC